MVGTGNSSEDNSLSQRKGGREQSGLCFSLMAILKCCIGNGFIIFSSYFSEYDMKENDGEFDEEDLEDNDMAIPRRYVAEDEIILDSFGNLRGQMM